MGTDFFNELIRDPWVCNETLNFLLYAVTFNNVYSNINRT